MMATRSSTVKRGCFSGLTRIAIVTSSKTDSPRPMMSRWPLVMGSKEPGKTASEHRRWPSRLRVGTLLLPPVEAETVVAHPDLAAPREAPYSLREGPFVEVLRDDHALVGEEARPAGSLQGGLVEVAVVGGVEVDHVEALLRVGEGPHRRPSVLAHDTNVASGAGERGGVGADGGDRVGGDVDEDDH